MAVETNEDEIHVSGKPDTEGLERIKKIRAAVKSGDKVTVLQAFERFNVLTGILSKASKYYAENREWFYATGTSCVIGVTLAEETVIKGCLGAEDECRKLIKELEETIENNA